MIRLPPMFTLTATHFPYTTLDRSDDRKLLAWFKLPKKLFDRASRKCRDGDAACLGDEDFCDLITAIVGAIMRSAPLRRENLSELRVGTDPEKNLGPNIYIPREPGRQG